MRATLALNTLKKTQRQVLSSCEICDIFTNTVFYRAPSMTASELFYFKINYKIYLKVPSRWNKHKEDTIKNSKLRKHSKENSR